MKTRKGFIDKEKDKETNTGNFGVRQDEPGDGRFVSVDPLWEEFRDQSPYHYSYNNPLVIKDPSGLSGNPILDKPGDEETDCGGGGGGSPWNDTHAPSSPKVPVGATYNPPAPANGMAGMGSSGSAGGGRATATGSGVGASGNGAKATSNPVYKNIPGRTKIGPGRNFSPRQKDSFRDQNAEANGGKMRCDETGKSLVKPQRSQRGVTPPSNEAHIDHIYPKSKGGTNDASNARVVSREVNLKKGDKIE